MVVVHHRKKYSKNNIVYPEVVFNTEPNFGATIIRMDSGIASNSCGGKACDSGLSVMQFNISMC